jgi:hypothetical protein
MLAEMKIQSTPTKAEFMENDRSLEGTHKAKDSSHSHSQNTSSTSR